MRRRNSFFCSSQAEKGQTRVAVYRSFVGNSNAGGEEGGRAVASLLNGCSRGLDFSGLSEGRNFLRFFTGERCTIVGKAILTIGALIDSKCNEIDLLEKAHNK